MLMEYVVSILRLPLLVANFYGAGLLLAAGIAALSFWIVEASWLRGSGLSPLTLAILLGIAAGNMLGERWIVAGTPGIDFAKTRLLRLGIILYGFQITLDDIQMVGGAGLLINLVIIFSTIAVALYLGRRVFRMEGAAALLIGIGSAICGAAAILAAASVVRAEARQVSVAVATVVLFGTLAMLIYPLAFPYLALSEQAYGIFVGSTIHEMAQVIGAGHAVGSEAAAMAVIQKMLRVMMLAPLLLLLSGYMSLRRAGEDVRQPLMIPWFALLFIAASLLNSFIPLPPGLHQKVVAADFFLLATAMAALGLQTQFAAVREAGLRPLLLAGAVFIFLALGGYAINFVVSNTISNFSQ